MNYDWQNIVALICVASASLYAAFWLFRSIREKTAGCGGCSSKKTDEPPARQIVSVEELAKAASRTER